VVVLAIPASYDAAATTKLSFATASITNYESNGGISTCRPLLKPRSWLKVGCVTKDGRFDPVLTI
jgi:hypothetical protein